jgi:hypothetical protein
MRYIISLAVGLLILILVVIVFNYKTNPWNGHPTGYCDTLPTNMGVLLCHLN